MGTKGRWVVWAGIFMCCTLAPASEPALVRIERRGPDDRALLIARGIPIVEEMGSSFLAMGEPEPLASRLASLGYEHSVLDPRTDGWFYSIASLHEGFPDAPQRLASCGEALWAEESWVLIRSFEPLSERCLESDRWFIRRLFTTSMSASRPPPAECAGLQEGPVGPLAAKPMVQTIVNAVTFPLLAYCWDDIISSATTRYSTSAGCTAATDAVYNASPASSPIYTFQYLGESPGMANAVNARGDAVGWTYAEALAVDSRMVSRGMTSLKSEDDRLYIAE